MAKEKKTIVQRIRSLKMKPGRILCWLATLPLLMLFYGMTYTYINPYTGSMPGIKAFVAAVFGGIGSLPGAMLGGVLMGIIESLASTYISGQLANAIVFGVLIIVLLVKPTGLLGKKVSEKV